MTLRIAGRSTYMNRKLGWMLLAASLVGIVLLKNPAPVWAHSCSAPLPLESCSGGVQCCYTGCGCPSGPGCIGDAACDADPNPPNCGCDCPHACHPACIPDCSGASCNGGDNGCGGTCDPDIVPGDGICCDSERPGGPDYVSGPLGHACNDCAVCGNIANNGTGTEGCFCDSAIGPPNCLVTGRPGYAP